MARHGENIRKRKDGRWEARYLQGYDENGKARYRCLYGKSYREVKQKREQELLQRERQSASGCGRYTFGKLAREWLDSRRGMVKESTFAIYSNTLNRQILPELDALPLSAMTAERLESFLNAKRQSGRLDGQGGLSAKSVADLRAILKLILEYGLQRDLPGLRNVQIHAPACRPKPIRVLSMPEQKSLEAVLFSEGDGTCLGILLSLYAGLRIGEVCALQWKDFHWQEGTVSVSKTVLRIQDTAVGAAAKTRVLIEKPKTPCSNRVIPLPGFLIQVLSAHQQPDSVYLITGTTHCIEPRTYLNRYKRILRKAQIPAYNYHCLRHTFATRCVENGVDIKSLSEIMGHSSVTITMQRYVHPSMELKREQINKLSAVSIYGQPEGQQAAANG